MVSTCMHSTSMGLGSTSTMLKPARTIKGDQGRSREIKGDQGRSMLTSTMLKPARTRKKRIIKKVDAMTCGEKAPW